MGGKRVTQADVASKCGVTRATVSLALRRHPSIPAATRERIHATARRLGYVPDPMLSALAAYRSHLQPTRYRGTLAWIARNDSTFTWNRIRHFVDYCDGARAAAQRAGYSLEMLDITATRGGMARVAEILHARNIAGVLLCPQPDSKTALALPWERLSAVTFGYTLVEPRLHTIAATQFRGSVMTVRQLHARGYRRIGFVIERTHNRRTDHNYLGGYLAAQHMLEAPAIPPLLIDKYRDSALLGPWIKKHRLDAVISGDYRFLDQAQRLGLRVPEDIGAACPLLPHKTGPLAGICEDCFHIGEVAMDFVIAMLQRGERGVPVLPQRVHVEGTWVEGSSLCPLPAGASVAADNSAAG